MGYYEEINGGNKKGETSADVPEAVNSKALTNDWGEKLGAFATNLTEYNQPFSREQLGHGQFMSIEKSAKSIALSNSRKRAGDAALASAEADLSWAKTRVVEEKVVGKQIEFGIERAKNVRKVNTLMYEVGRIPLEGEEQLLKLNQLANRVQGLRSSVRASTSTISIDAGEEIKEVDFMAIEIEE